MSEPFEAQDELKLRPLKRRLGTYAGTSKPLGASLKTAATYRSGTREGAVLARYH
jgi:hypothetical protein